MFTMSSLTASPIVNGLSHTILNPFHEEKQIDIIDIRSDTAESSVLDDVLSGLQAPAGQTKSLPTILLYDAPGLKLFEEITYLNEYYLTNNEIELLQEQAQSIANSIEPGSMVVELGSGNLRKVDILLKALDRVGAPFDYYALDLSRSELERTLSAIPPGTYKNVRCHGLHGTYDDGLKWLKNESKNQVRSKCILWLGSSIGNFTRGDAADFLSVFAKDGLRSGTPDSMLIAIDACKDHDKVYRAYNDSEGVTEKFILNGMEHANVLLGEKVFNTDEWDYVGEYDVEGGRHRAYVVPKKDFEYKDIHIPKGEKVFIEQSNKYSVEDAHEVFGAAGLEERRQWSTKSGEHRIYQVTRPSVFPMKPAEYVATPTPSLDDWRDLWALWDSVTQGMIPKAELLSKPIDLRNACIFYLGHIPTFLDIHLTRALKTPPTEPKYYYQIFERGIDPDVDDPEQCHTHSEIPDSWPEEAEILGFQRKVRDRVSNLYKDGKTPADIAIGRSLWLAFEHEVMHVETLLYMLLQSDKMLSPPGRPRPDFVQLAIEADKSFVEAEWISIPEQNIKLGLDDSEDNTGASRYYGWDNEKPSREVTVPAFQALSRPITNKDYAEFLIKTQKESVPASWDVHPGTTNGYHDAASNSALEKFIAKKFVKTVYGKVPLSQALHWPIMASYDELAAYAKWMDGRIPTQEEVRSLYSHAETLKNSSFSNVLSRKISAVNGHLSNDGVEETPPSVASSEAVLDPSPLFADLTGCNVGFQHWHPTPVTSTARLLGRGETGGIWEWSSSVLEPHEGFEPMPLYELYTKDFFDGKHNVVLGGSWATHPRVAGRKSFVNWYQRNYPYAWTGARVVRDSP